MSRTAMTLALAAFFGMTTVASAAAKGIKAIPKNRTAHHLHHVRGVVVAVRHDMAKGQGEIQVKVHHRHPKKRAKNAAAAATVRKKTAEGIQTFHVTQASKINRVVHGLGAVQRHKTPFGDVHKGEHVRVGFNSKHHAREVNVIVHVHKKLPKALKKVKKLKKVK